MYIQEESGIDLSNDNLMGMDQPYRPKNSVA
jgi:hypothetical protein